MQKVKEIRFKVDHEATLLNPDHSFATTVKGLKEHVWVHGLGPCGREVVDLSYEISLYALTIRQTSYPVGFLKVQEEALQSIRLERTGLARAGAVAAYHKALEGAKVEQFVYPLDMIRGRIRAEI